MIGVVIGLPYEKKKGTMASQNPSVLVCRVVVRRCGWRNCVGIGFSGELFGVAGFCYDERVFDYDLYGTTPVCFWCFGGFSGIFLKFCEGVARAGGRKIYTKFL